MKGEHFLASMVRVHPLTTRETAPDADGFVQECKFGYSMDCFCAVQLMADAIRIRRRPESDRGLVPGRPAAGNKEQSASLKIEDTRRAAILAVDGGSQHIPIQLPRTSKIADHQQVGKLNPLRGKIGLRHHSPP